MFGRKKQKDMFFESLCEAYYEKVLRYLFSSLGNEAAARDCTQDVFLTALQKEPLLKQHPNPGGFLFQTAKNLAQKSRREGFRRMLRGESLDDADREYADESSGIETILDRQIDEQAYIADVLGRLSEDKWQLYTAYYVHRKPMAQIAQELGVEQSALRMRYVRLRREIRAIAAEVAEQYFIS